jgi:hypothetical protein
MNRRRYIKIKAEKTERRARSLVAINGTNLNRLAIAGKIKYYCLKLK